MRYLSVIIVSFVMLVFDVSMINAGANAQQPTTTNPINPNSNKKDICRPGQVFIPSTGACSCPKAQYQEIDLGSV